MVYYYSRLGITLLLLDKRYLRLGCIKKNYSRVESLCVSFSMSAECHRITLSSVDSPLPPPPPPTPTPSLPLMSVFLFCLFSFHMFLTYIYTTFCYQYLRVLITSNTALCNAVVTHQGISLDGYDSFLFFVVVFRSVWMADHICQYMRVLNYGRKFKG